MSYRRVLFIIAIAGIYFLQLSPAETRVLQLLLAQGAPVKVDSADPPSGERGVLNLDVTIRGKGFKNDAVAQFFVSGTENPGGIVVHSTQFINSTTLVSNISIDSSAELGGFDIQVLTQGRRGKGIDLFTVVSSGGGGQGNDNVAPDPVGNLSVDSIDVISAGISWTASGDDGMVGTATSYDIRYLPGDVITEQNWAAAFPAIPILVAIPTPAAPGTLQSFIFGNLEPETFYSFGVQVIDDAGNRSPVAAVQATTNAIPPTQWSFQFVTSGKLADMAVDPDGLPAIAYTEGSVLSVARWNGITWDLEVVDDSNNNLGAIDLAFSPAGYPAIAYDANYRRLSYARFNGSTWEIESPDSISKKSKSLALAFNDQGTALIAYEASAGKTSDLVLARSGLSGWTLEVVEHGVAPQWLDMTLSDLGYPAIVFSDLDTTRLAEFDGAWWATEVVSLGPAFARQIAFSPATQDFVVKEVNGSALGKIEYLERSPQGWVAEAITPDWYGSSLALDDSGTPYITYRSVSGPARYLASRTGDPSNPWVHEFVAVQDNEAAKLEIVVTEVGEIAYMAFETSDGIWLGVRLLNPNP